MRLLAVLSTLPLLAGALSAQCINTAGGTSAGLVATTIWPAHDEGRSAPIDMLFGPGGFPMQGAVGPLTHAVVGSNGELYLTSGGAAVDPIDYGAFDVNDLRGIAGASPRIWPFSTDLEGLAAGWAVTVDTSVAGRFKVNWIDVELYFSGGPQFSCSASLFSTGVIELTYGTLPTFAFALAGVSIGNAVGTGLETPVDLTTGPDSGALGMIFQETDGINAPSFGNRTITLIPNGLGGYLSVVTCEPASHAVLGFGCHSYAGPDTANLFEEFTGTPAAKAALDGNALLFSLGGPGYVANWLPTVAGALYLAPSGGATTVALTDDSTATITPSMAPPIPGGFAPTWTISSNGILTADAIGNHGGQYFANLPDIATEPGLAFYCWRDYNPSIAGSGQVKHEEVGGVLYVTYDGVFEYATTAPATFQWQVNLTTGEVIMVFVSMATTSNTTPMIVGCTLAGAGAVPVSTPLATSTPFVLAPQVTLTPMTLSATPPPVINPSTAVTYTVNDLPEFVPTSGIYLSTLFLSVNPNPFGFDLNGILTTQPGCNAWIVTLDLDLGAQVTIAPTASWNFTFSNVFFAPGNVIAAQAVALFDGSFPLANGESGGFLLSNGVRSYVDVQ